MSSLCSGCKASCKERYFRSLPTRKKRTFKEFQINCPCTKCIVKMTCESICFDYYINVTGGERNMMIARHIKKDDWTALSFLDDRVDKTTLIGYESNNV